MLCKNLIDSYQNRSKIAVCYKRKMKYGIILFQYKYEMMKKETEKSWNIGDVIQVYAVKQLYKKMGIEESEIIEIYEEEIEHYKGEYVVVIMNFYGGVLKYNLSPYIIPVFCGFN